MKKGLSGFTLLEILIVLIILGIMASLTVPSFTGQVERSRAVEALKRLKLTREALANFHAENGTFLGATIPLAGGGTLAYNPNSRPFGETLLFTYTFSALGNNFYTVRATRNAFAGCATIGRIEADQNGAVNGTGAYVGL